MVRTLARIALAAALAAGPAFAASAAEGPGMSGPAPSLFGSRETRSFNISMFPKWSGALTRFFGERQLEEAPCSASAFNRCHLREWKAFLAEQEGKDRRAQVEAVNAYMNRQPYLTDPRNYGVSDYWATPVQFFSRDGDCEDYAIAKFLSLRALGFDNDMLRVVVLQDLNLRVGHAVLAVYLDGEALILDNQIRRVVEDGRIRHYKPIYSINEHHWWLHQRG
jgi:predicted transglutaminase-like cysteine proteinase